MILNQAIFQLDSLFDNIKVIFIYMNKYWVSSVICNHCIGHCVLFGKSIFKVLTSFKKFVIHLTEIEVREIRIPRFPPVGNAALWPKGGDDAFFVCIPRSTLFISPDGFFHFFCNPCHKIILC